MCASIDEVTQAIESGTTSIIEYQNAIRDIDFEVFELIQERISDITAESDFLIELMSNKKLFSDKGNLTSQGFATMALHGQNYNSYMYQADDYGAEVAKLDKQIAKDPYDKELIDKRREYIELQREMILNAEEEKNAIKDLVSEGIELQLDSLSELIDKYNDALDSQKDLYDYQKRVEEQTKEISSLQKQLSAYEGDNSEEARAKIQELRVSLEEAESNLQETEYDKFISDQSALLDNLFLEAETIFNERIDNTDALVTEVIDGINAAANNLSIGNDNILSTLIGTESTLEGALDADVTNIQSTLTSEAEKVGTTLSNAMNSIWSVGDGSIKSVLSMYGNNFQNKQTTTNSTLSRIEVSVNSMLSSLNKEAEKNVTSNKPSSSDKKNPTTKAAETVKNLNDKKDNNDKKPALTDSKLKGIAAAIWVYGSKAGWEDDPTRKNKLTAKLGAENAKKVQGYINELGANGGLYKYWTSNNLKLDNYKYSAFKLGAKNVDETQLAWTQEQGREYIVRPSDGAILTPVAKGDSVLTSAATNNIWQMANSPAEFIKDNLNLGTTSVPNNSTIQNGYNQTIESVVFSMPNVRNYDELITQMQRDPNFERLVEAMSIGKLAGKSSLSKGKAIR